MNQKELLEIIEKGESEEREFKKSTAQLEKGMRALCAFLNHKGGAVYFGIDNKTLFGQQVSDPTLRSISQKVRQKIKPEITPEITVHGDGREKIIKVAVKEGLNKLHYLDGVAYKRVGTENPLIPPEEIERIIMEKRKNIWDSEICEEANLKDIDGEKVKWFLRTAKIKRGLKIPENTPLKEVLTKLKLLKNNKLTNSAVLLFSKESEFLQSEVKCIRFSGNESVKPYIDFQTLEGNVFDLIDEAENFVLRNIKMAIWLVPGQVQREEKYEYPPDAIREAIANAVVHRDYESPSKVQVRIFNNRVEVWSPGLLPKEISIEDLKKEHRSVPRNPLLFKQLFWVKYVEDVGGGTVDMINWCKEWGLPEPEFKIITGALVVIFRLPPNIEDLEKLGLNERQKKAVDYVTKHTHITNKDYQLLNNTTRYTATRDFTILVDKGIFRTTGDGRRNLKYILVQNASKMRQKMRQKSKAEGEL
ncbi:MAG: hypothetical protein CVT88_03290 [Candidatus Altiarchaeales archaeon HGW-Altiarchaeales-1]|nr:MAG: hypothetical protein CVT88_03290 [Candidatus Altiarchaeales archaeon HGW-Altiarchaeales-1]